MTLPALTFDGQTDKAVLRLGAALTALAQRDGALFKNLFSRQQVTEAALGPPLLKDLKAFGMVEPSGPAWCGLFTAKLIGGRVIVSDGAWHSRNLDSLMVDPLWEGHRIADLLVKSPAKLGLDMGVGSGVLSLAMAGYCDHVWGLDINPRALEFARFNARLNGVTNVTFAHSDLFSAVSHLKFDRMVFSAPVGEELAPRSMLESGQEILAAFFAQAPAHLADGGYAQVNLCARDFAGDPFFARLDRWLGPHAPHVQYLFLQLWRRSGFLGNSGGPRVIKRFLLNCWRARANPLRCRALFRGFLTLRKGPGGASWLIPADYHAWSGEQIDGAAGAFAAAAITDLRPDAPDLPGEATLDAAAGRRLRAAARPIPRP